MASKYDLSHLGKRALNTIRKNGGDTFLDKVIKNRDFADGKLYRNPKVEPWKQNLNIGNKAQSVISYPCVGLCEDENGNLVWIPNSSKFLDREDLFRLSASDFNDIELDPISHTEDPSEFASEYAKGLVSGDYNIGDLEDIIKRKGWKKYSKVYDDGSIVRYSTVPDFFPGTYGDDSYTGGVFVTSPDHWYFNEPHYKAGLVHRNKRKNPIPYLNVSRLDDVFSKTSTFANPSNMRGEDMKYLKRMGWGLDNWNMRGVKKNERYDVSSEISPVELRGSRTRVRNTTQQDPLENGTTYNVFLKRYHFIQSKSDAIRKHLFKKYRNNEIGLDEYNKLQEEILEKRDNELLELKEKMNFLGKRMNGVK